MVDVFYSQCFDDVSFQGVLRMSPRYRYEQEADGDTCAVASPEEEALPVRKQYITQSLEHIDIKYLMMLNPAFRRIISSGDYVITDNHICLFSPECIRSGKDPNTLKLNTCVLQNPELYCLSLISKLPPAEEAPHDLIALIGKNSDRANKFHYTRLFYSAMQFAHAGKYEKMKEEGINPDEFYKKEVCAYAWHW